MKDLFRTHGICEVAEKGYKESQDQDSQTQTQNYILKNSRKRDNIALFLVYLALDEDATYVKEAWGKLQSTWKGVGNVNSWV